ncbi:MAG: TRAP transporter substrate-binding protein [Oscillibacter sp.]|jgi:tripartite ATP-independent transporter DctP family solute receptor|nr:TRAP transporter substrate-binding protein [Oscillibacter sp.]
MKKLTRIFALACALSLVFALSACGGSGGAGSAAAPSGSAGASSGVTVLKLGTTVNEEDSFQVAAQKFADLVKERTNGAYEIEIYPNGALGDESTMLESMQIGTLDAGIITSGPFVNFVPEMGVLDMPFLFADNDQAYKILDGEVGQELLGKLEGSNLKGLAFAERGFRNLTNSVRPVKTAADIAGLKVRVMENEVYTATFTALGVNAVPMAWSEALTALQQNTIDGQENPVNVLYSYKLWETQKYATLTRHAYASAVITMSLDVFNSLPADVQEIFSASAQEAAEYERSWVADNEADQLKALEDNGMEIVEDPDLDSFKTAVQSVYDSYPQYADYLSRIQSELG